MCVEGRGEGRAGRGETKAALRGVQGAEREQRRGAGRPLAETGSEKAQVGRAGLAGLWPAQGERGDGRGGWSGAGAGGGILRVMLKGESLELRREGPESPRRDNAGWEWWGPQQGG